MSGSHLSKVFIPTPPDRGSFPLDHQNVCKKKMLAYLFCLSDHNQDNSKCRAEAKEYLACRMDNSLMAKEEWSYLGFEESKSDSDSHEN